jgi:type IV secretory pathway TrbD component
MPQHEESAVRHQPAHRPVYKAMHRRLTVWGVERRLFFLAMLMGAATFNLFYSFLAGLLMFASLYGLALWATERDPDMLHILLSSSRARRRFDPGKHDRADVEVATW